MCDFTAPRLRFGERGRTITKSESCRSAGAASIAGTKAVASSAFHRRRGGVPLPPLGFTSKEGGIALQRRSTH